MEKTKTQILKSYICIYRLYIERGGRKVNKNALFFGLLSLGGLFRRSVSNLHFVKTKNL